MEEVRKTRESSSPRQAAVPSRGSTATTSMLLLLAQPWWKGACLEATGTLLTSTLPARAALSATHPHPPRTVSIHWTPHSEDTRGNTCLSTCPRLAARGPSRAGRCPQLSQCSLQPSQPCSMPRRPQSRFASTEACCAKNREREVRLELLAAPAPSLPPRYARSWQRSAGSEVRTFSAASSTTAHREASCPTAMCSSMGGPLRTHRRACGPSCSDTGGT